MPVLGVAVCGTAVLVAGVTLLARGADPGLPAAAESRATSPGDAAAAGDVAPERTAALVDATQAHEDYEARLTEHLGGKGDPALAMAVLQRITERRPQDWPALFARCVRSPGSRRAPAAGGDTPAEYALQRLVRAAAEDAVAVRSALAAIAFSVGEVPATDRERAAVAWAATSPAAERGAVAAWSAGSADPALRTALARGLVLAGGD